MEQTQKGFLYIDVDAIVLLFLSKRLAFFIHIVFYYITIVFTILLKLSYMNKKLLILENTLDLSDKISSILKQKGMTKKFFAERLRTLHPTIKSTGEAPSMSSIYGYLNGSREIKAELLPYIAEVLNITVGELFEENEKERIKILKTILDKPTQSESKLLERYCKIEDKLSTQKYKNDTNYNLYSYVVSLLPYSSEKFLNKLIDVLESFKDSTRIAQEEIGV